MKLYSIVSLVFDYPSEILECWIPPMVFFRRTARSHILTP